jgi:hypothetical protein
LDVGYRRFLSQLADPLLQRLACSTMSTTTTTTYRGLDYGCGPGPALVGLHSLPGVGLGYMMTMPAVIK